MSQQVEIAYPNDPIVEALLEIQIKPRNQIEPSVFSQISSDIKNDYPTFKNLVVVQSEFSVGPEVGALARQFPVGIVFISSNQKQQFQARNDGIIYSCLHPYPGWDNFKSEAKRLWGIYRNYIELESLTQISVRYINQLNFPQPAQIDEYLQIYPQISVNFTGELTDFFMQVQLAQEDLNARSVLVQGVIPSSSEDKVSVLLDITLMRNKDLRLDDSFIWNLFQDFRVRKNEIFESCIQDKTRELLK